MARATHRPAQHRAAQHRAAQHRAAQHRSAQRGSVRSLLGLAALLLTAPFAVGCWGQTSEEPPILPIRNMHDNPRYDPQAASPYFPDGRTMRPEVLHAVAREMVVDPEIDTGLEDDGSYVMTIPEPMVEGAGGMAGLLSRGQDRYGIYCVPCHGGLGDGQGMVPQTAGPSAAAIQPPTFHDDRIRHMPDGQLYATIRNGIRNMPAYAHNIPVQDRWAIVAYVRALQLSQADARTAMNERATGRAREAGRAGEEGALR